MSALSPNRPGFWAELLAYASTAQRDAREATDPKRRHTRLTDAQFYVRLARGYPNPRLP